MKTDRKKIINDLLASSMSKSSSPKKKWKQNIKVYNRLLWYLALNPLITIISLVKGWWLITILWITPTVFGLGTAFYGQRFILGAMQLLMEAKEGWEIIFSNIKSMFRRR